MEDEILKIMAAEIAGENVTKEEREKMNRWWEEKRGNERTYKMLMGELGEVVRLVRQQGGLDREKAYERLESDIRKTPGNSNFRLDGLIDGMQACIRVVSGYTGSYEITRRYEYE